MAKYIDAEKLKSEIMKLRSESTISESDDYYEYAKSRIIDIVDSLQQDKTAVELELCSQVWWEEQGWIMIPPNVTIKGIDSLLKAVRRKLQQDSVSCDDNISLHQPDMDLKKFTQKMNDWKARYNYPDNFSIKATMAFTARMFCMYPDIAREWYDSLPKVTMDEQNNEK